MVNGLRRSKLLTSFFQLTLFLTIFLISHEVTATHFRYGHLTWKPKPSASSTTVEFTFIGAFKRSVYGTPVVGSEFNETVGATGLLFGDGTNTGTMRFKVISIDEDNDWLMAVALDPSDNTKQTISHTYSASTNNGNPWVAVVSGCCRKSDLSNNANGNYSIITYVETASGNSSPVSSIPAVINVPKKNSFTFQIPASDIDANTKLVFRLATVAEAASNVSYTKPAGLTISSTGLISWNTSSLTTGNSYTLQVIIEDWNATNNNFKTQVGVDFIMQISGCTTTNSVPYFSNSDNCGSVLKVKVGKTLKLNVEANDDDNNANVTLNSGGLPNGAKAGTTLPAKGKNKAKSEISWSPKKSDIGTYIVAFTATDVCGDQDFCFYTINVENEDITPVKATASGTNLTCYGGSNGTATVTATEGTSPYTYLWSNSKTTPSISGLSAGTYTVTVTDANGTTATASVSITSPPQLIANAGNDDTVYYGYSPMESTTLKASGSGGTGSYSFKWSNNSNSQNITVSPTKTTTYTCTVTDANGCTTTDQVIVNVIDVRCGHNLNKVYVCHNSQTICISANAVPSHFDEHSDDYIGQCYSRGKNGNSEEVLFPEEEIIITSQTLKAYPNPFNSNTTIEFSTNEDQFATIDIYNIQGQLLKTVFSGNVKSGSSNKINFSKQEFSSNIYYVRLTSGNDVQIIKLMLIK